MRPPFFAGCVSGGLQAGGALAPAPSAWSSTTSAACGCQPCKFSTRWANCTDESAFREAAGELGCSSAPARPVRRVARGHRSFTVRWRGPACAALVSLVKQIDVPPGALEAHHVTRKLVDQHPIWLDVGITEATPAAFQ